MAQAGTFRQFVARTDFERTWIRFFTASMDSVLAMTFCRLPTHDTGRSSKYPILPFTKACARQTSVLSAGVLFMLPAIVVPKPRVDLEWSVRRMDVRHDQ